MKTGRMFFQSALGIVLLAIVFSIAVSAQTGGIYIKGVVKSSAGKLLTSVWVTISQNGVEKGRSLTGDDGKFYISNLDAGEYEIVVLQRDREVYKEQVKLLEDSRYDISLKPRR